MPLVSQYSFFVNMMDALKPFSYKIQNYLGIDGFEFLAIVQSVIKDSLNIFLFSPTS